MGNYAKNYAKDTREARALLLQARKLLEPHVHHDIIDPIGDVLQMLADETGDSDDDEDD